ncbi:MAG: NADH-quinone oxidoreductase subunit C [Candidatus Eisenbacteria bacterium]|nr:NADH-quinone oxidoreductase subunit C [Candidatus Eisenbacteria bacterium]
MTIAGELFPLDRALRGIRDRFAGAVIDADRTSMREHLVVLPAERLAEVAGAVANEWGGTFLTMFALDERAEAGRFRLHVMFSMAPEDAILTLVGAVPEHAPSYPAVTTTVHAAHWCERELAELLGVTPAGHPSPGPLVGHDGWPAGMHPLRRDFSPPADVAWPPRFSFVPVEGEGVFEIPVGPIHAGVIEPGHFRFSSVGEAVLKLDLKLGWAWRGLEKLAEGASLTRGLEIAERLCGTCAYSHALGFCLAAEELAGAPVPQRGRALRSLAGELERIANHLLDMSGILTDVAWRVGAADLARQREVVQQACDALFGHRFLRGVCVPGGVARDLDDTQQLWLRRTLAEVRAEVQRASQLATANPSVMDRLVGTGVLPGGVARDLGVTGVAARASGLAMDGRRDHPYAFYRDLDFQVVGRQAGDVHARYEQRLAEVHESLNLVDQMILRLPGGPIAQHLGELPPGRWGFGLVESPRGLASHWLRADAHGRIGSWRVRSASHAIWPAVAHVMPGNIVPDFPLINKSFNLCYACTDK